MIDDPRPVINDTTRYTVAFACNDADGAFTGRVGVIEVEGIITLIGPTDASDSVATTAFGRNEWSFTLDGTKSFGHLGHATYVGNLCWEDFTMKSGAVLRLLNYLKTTGKWECTNAIAGLDERWRTAERLVMADLRGEVGA